MNRRRFLLAAPAALALVDGAAALAKTAVRKKGVMLFNRISPKTSELYIANADGSNERKFLEKSTFDYHASFTPDGKSVLFTSERGGLGNSDIYRARIDGSGIEPVLTGPAIEDAGVLSPDGTKVAFVSSRQGYRANIWVYDIKTKQARNLTGGPQTQGDPELPDGFFRPAWSPDSKWIVFSSDRNTDWRGHDKGAGWEHTQELSLYVIRADGTGFRRLASKPDYSLGSPKWSPDGKWVVFYEMTTEATWGPRRPELIDQTTSQVVSVDVNTGERVEHTSGPGLKMFPQFLSATEIAYHRRGGKDEGVRYTSGAPGFNRALRSPNWSPDGKRVVYEKIEFKTRWDEGRPLYSWDPQWDYHYTDIFPELSRDGKWMVMTEKDSNSSIVIMRPDGSGKKRIYDAQRMAQDAGLTPGVRVGGGGAYYPAWSPDGQWVAFGVGEWFQRRDVGHAVVMRVRVDGTGLEPLTDGKVHSGFPSYSADGKNVVFRVWGQGAEGERGLRILDLDTRKISTLTTDWDNLPAWSPDGKLIMFTRKVDDVNYDIYTIRPDGSDLNRLTTNRSNDGHAVWTAEGKVLWDSGYYGWRDEAALYDNTFQPYGQVWIMNADGSGKRVLTDSLWEDSTPLYLPNSVLHAQS